MNGSFNETNQATAYITDVSLPDFDRICEFAYSGRFTLNAARDRNTKLKKKDVFAYAEPLATCKKVRAICKIDRAFTFGSKSWGTHKLTYGSTAIYPDLDFRANGWFSSPSKNNRKEDIPV